MSTDSYLTIASPAEGIYREKGSRFVSFAFPVQSEGDCKKYIKHVRQEHHKARHVCHAYRLGADGNLFRTNDADEPKGSGGVPILNVIDSKRLTNVLVVVARYFGGTKLGLPGLMRAYRSSAQSALTHSVVIERFLTTRFEITCGHAEVNHVMKWVNGFSATMIAQTFDEVCRFTLDVRQRDAEGARLALERFPDMHVHLPDAS